MKLPPIRKTAYVTPLHKRGPKVHTSDYRPFSSTSKVCKSLEKLIRDKLVNHMEGNGLFTNHQHGCRKNRLCTTQLTEIMEEWTSNLDEGKSLDIIYLDFQKAFDTVPHERLLIKLNNYGIQGNL